MVARGAGAAGPVLLACRLSDPLRLARRLPSLGVGAWRSAPLLPWQVQRPVRVCAALAAGSGGSDRYLVLCLSRFPLPAPCVPRCVWRAVQSGCPVPSLAGTPFQRSVPSASLIRLPFWYSLRALCVCVRSRSRGVRSAPPLGGVACAPCAVPALGAGRAVPRGPCPSACPVPVPCSVWRASGGGGPVLVPAYLSSGCAPPMGRVRGVCPVGAACRGGGGGPSLGGVACHRCEGRLVSGAVPPQAARPLERAARVPGPVCPGCGRCGRGDPAPAPRRAPLRAGVARCGGGGRASQGGVPSTIVRGVWCQALSLPLPPVLWSG